MQRRREEREQRERGRMRHRNNREREEARMVETPQSTELEGGVDENRPRTERSDSAMDAEAGGEASISQLQSRHKKGYMNLVPNIIVPYCQTRQRSMNPYKLSWNISNIYCIKAVFHYS